MIDKSTIIHILRNPYGHSQEEIKAVRLAAADLLDVPEQKSDCLVTPFSSSICIHDTFGCKIDHGAPRPSAPTGQINPDSQEGDHG